MAGNINEQLLEEKLIALESARQWNPRVVSKLENLIRSGDDLDLFRVNPIRYAGMQGMNEGEAIDLFLHAAKVGLFEMRWNMVCAGCASVFGSFEHLSGVHSEFVCEACKYENTVSMDDLIHVTFTILPQIRDIIFNHPQKLSAEDYYFKYHLVEGALFPPDTPFDDLIQQFVQVTEYLESQDTKTYDLDLEPGLLLVRSIDASSATIFNISPHEGNADIQSAKLIFGEQGLESPNPHLQPARLEANGMMFQIDLAGEFNAGKLKLEVENTLSQRVALLILTTPPIEPLILTFAPFLSGKRLLTVQTFRDLFRNEAVGANEGISVKDITLMFTDLTGSTALYDRIGDAHAFFLVHQHFDTLQKAINENHGAIVKTIGDAVMATFMHPEEAVRAALQSLEELDRFNQTIREDIILKIGIHRGHCIAVTSNDRPDYFGQTVNIAARIQGLARAGEIYLSDAVFSSPNVQQEISRHQVTDEEVRVRGVGKALLVHKVST